MAGGEGGSAGAMGGAMWGGMFEGGAEAVFRALNDSLPFDWRLVQEDVRGSIAWGRAIASAGVFSEAELAEVVRALGAIGEEAAGLGGPPVESGAEDVHTWVEQRLIARAGELGKRLHTGRSRNDQVATDLRLWAKSACGTLIEAVALVRGALIDVAEREAETAMPAYTHLQRAQPITAGHWALAYEAMLARDARRLVLARESADACPLGCAALAGTTLAVDREAIARDLGFMRAAENSIDAVSDRDFVLDLIHACVQCATHLSRLGEDLIIYASAEFAFVRMADGVTSGSSLMPQKKNPDACELLRGSAGRVLGRYAGFAATLKGLPTAYNKDLQEDKEAVFDAVDRTRACLVLAERVVAGLVFDRERCARAAETGFLNATELADYLVSKGVAFRDAHDAVGRCVRHAMSKGVGLESLAVIREVEPRVGDDAAAWLTVARMLERRGALGGTSPVRVREAAGAARSRLVSERA
ncbi:MAG: argininosuccinate lyase [Phycisphaerales bacterium]|nr:MAG: argininosuccinate lyase [Phycisphaerales bacterium]